MNLLKVEPFVKLIREGKVVAFPTETVYGLGADVWNEEAIQQVFLRKGRPSDNPLIVHISEPNSLDQLASDIPDDAYRLADAFWPGPLTLVLKKHPSVPDIVTGGLDTVAVRIPDHPLALKLIRLTGPLVAPSANLSGKPSPTSTDHVLEDFGESVAILDGGATQVGLESTVLDLSGNEPTILRPGAIGPQEIFERTGIKAKYTDTESDDASLPRSPGVKYRHYKPKAKVIYGPILEYSSDTLYLTQDSTSVSTNVIAYGGNLATLSSELYRRFREADKMGYQKVHIAPIENFKERYEATYIALLNRIEKAIS